MKRTVCIDLDGVLADYSQGFQGVDVIGDPIPGSVEFTKALSEFASILIYTTRCSERVKGGNLGAVPDGGDSRSAEELRSTIRDWLEKHGFAYDDIWIGQGKPIASAYVDDRAVSCQPQLHGSLQFQVALHRTRYLIFPEPSQFKGAAETVKE